MDRFSTFGPKWVGTCLRHLFIEFLTLQACNYRWILCIPATKGSKKVFLCPPPWNPPVAPLVLACSSWRLSAGSRHVLCTNTFVHCIKNKIILRVLYKQLFILNTCFIIITGLFKNKLDRSNRLVCNVKLQQWV